MEHETSPTISPIFVYMRNYICLRRNICWPISFWGNKDVEQLGAWLLGDPERPSDRHKEIVIELYKDAVQPEESYLNPGNILGQIAIQYYESMHPGFIEALVNEALKDIRIEIVQDGTSADSAATE